MSKGKGSEKKKKRMKQAGARAQWITRARLSAEKRENDFHKQHETKETKT